MIHFKNTPQLKAVSKWLFVSPLALATLTGCFETDQERENKVRPGCVNEKMSQDGYTYDYALLVCEGQTFMYGNEDRPQYEIDLEEAEREIDNALRELEQSLEDWGS